jgi:NAD-dependent dihydropyrimidine dehydrogenase PreA subunit
LGGFRGVGCFSRTIAVLLVSERGLSAGAAWRSIVMQPDRREFLKHAGWVVGAGAGVLAPRTVRASGHGYAGAPPDAMGVLVDLTVCIGCRLCEHACKKANGIEPGPVESYDDPSVFQQRRRPAPSRS